jgi:hypothetical protein
VLKRLVTIVRPTAAGKKKNVLGLMRVSSLCSGPFCGDRQDPRGAGARGEAGQEGGHRLLQGQHHRDMSSTRRMRVHSWL